MSLKSKLRDAWKKIFPPNELDILFEEHRKRRLQMNPDSVRQQLDKIIKENPEVRKDTALLLGTEGGVTTYFTCMETGLTPERTEQAIRFLDISGWVAKHPTETYADQPVYYLVPNAMRVLPEEPDPQLLENTA